MRLGFIFLPLTSNWVWVPYTWYLADLFLSNLWEIWSLLSKLKHFSRHWISLMSSLFSCSTVKQWPPGHFTVCCCHRCHRYRKIVAASQELNIFGVSLLPTFVGTRDELKLGICPSGSATCAGSVNSLSHPSIDSGQSMKPLLIDRRGAESCNQPRVFPRGERPCTSQKGWSPSEKKKSKLFLLLSWRYVDSEFQFLISEVSYQRPECAAVCMCEDVTVVTL